MNGKQWLFLAPRSSEKSRENFISTLDSGYPIDEIEEFLSEEDRAVLAPRNKLYIWGNQPAKAGSWKKMEIGDVVAFYAKGEFVYVGKCILKKHSPEIARQLWGNVPGKDTTWEYVFFLDSIRPITIPLSVIKNVAGYEEKMIVQGFMPLNEQGMANILNVYGSLTSLFDNYSAGLNTKEFAILEEISEKENLTAKDIEEIDAVARDRDLELLLREWEQRKSSEEPEAVQRKATTIKRNTALVRKMKEHHSNKCQICGFTFKQKNGDYYSEVAHIEPISSQKAGVDVPSNMIVLCPNHHKMLDYGKLEIISVSQYKLDGDVKDLQEPLFSL